MRGGYTMLSRWAFAALAVLMVLGWPASAGAEQRVALVIGIGAYKNVPFLPNPRNDARAIAAALARLGFSVDLYQDLGLEPMRAAFKNFEEKAEQADWALVYFAGHGLEMNGENWLVPADASLAKASDVPDEAVPLNRVLERVRPARNLRLVFLDACRNNPFLTRMIMGRGRARRAVEQGLAPIEPDHGEAVFYAARHGSVASDGGGEHSPFTEAVLAYLEKPGLELGLFFREVTSAVREKTRPPQEPFLYGSLPRTAFYFRAPEKGAAPPPATPGMAAGQTALTKQPKAAVTYEDAAQGLVRTFAGHSGAVFSVAFSPDGRFALSGGGDRKLKLWEAATGRLLRTFTGYSGAIFSVAFSPDGRLALSGGDDKTPRFCEVATGRELRIVTRHSDNVNAVTFSPDGRFALSGSGDKKLKLWEVATGHEVHTFTGHSGIVFAAAFSPDGRFALSGSSDDTLTLWEVATGRLLHIFTGHSHGVWSVAFFPHGRFALSGSGDTTLKLWDLSPYTTARP